MKKKCWKFYSQKKHVSSDSKKRIMKIMNSPVLFPLFVFIEVFSFLVICFGMIYSVWTGRIGLGLMVFCIAVIWVFILYTSFSDYFSDRIAGKKTLQNFPRRSSDTEVSPSQNAESDGQTDPE